MGRVASGVGTVGLGVVLAILLLIQGALVMVACIAAMLVVSLTYLFGSPVYLWQHRSKLRQNPTEQVVGLLKDWAFSLALGLGIVTDSRGGD